MSTNSTPIGVELEVVQHVPDVGTLFEYGVDGLGRGPARYRVSAWMRVRPHQMDPIDMAEAGALPQECGGHFALTMAELKRDDPAPAVPTLEFCVRSQATHVCGKGVGGCIAPISKIKVTGMVDWPESLLKQARATALFLARKAARQASWIPPIERSPIAPASGVGDADEPSRGDAPRFR